ncbi:MAG: response regulator [Deltaproteobacteria bacterium]|nr:response regulator [Deltaproteobacteria bacterium]
MKYRMLLVDDDKNLLAAYQRGLRKTFETDVAITGANALELIAERGPYCIVVSDYRMPGMDGIQFLSRVREVTPDTVRILLTGYADLETSTRAVNETNVFRLLTKPCPPDVMSQALVSGLRQYQLVTGERELLEKTLNGSIRVMTELLALAKPQAFDRASRISRYVSLLCRTVNDPEPWQAETAARLSQIGLILLPDETLDKVNRGRTLSTSEKESIDEHPAMAAKLLANIPRMEAIADIVACQKKHFDGTGIPSDDRQGEELPLGARILHVAVDFDALTSAGKSKGESYAEMRRHPKWYDPKVLNALSLVLGDEAKFSIKSVEVVGLREGMILAEDVFSLNNSKLLLAKGHELTEPIVEQFRRYKAIFNIKEPIKIIQPLNLL